MDKVHNLELMIREEICTYEVCKLAKEKGFPQDVFGTCEMKSSCYLEDGRFYKDGCICPIENAYTAPTQSLLQRWLREEKGYYVYPFFDNIQLRRDWVCREKTGDKWIPLGGYDYHLFDTYELALEDALKNEISTYTKVDKNDTKGRTWYKIYYAGTDSKYGAFMVSPDTKEYRNTTMSEFYGGGIVD